MAFQERSIDQIRDVDPNSILAMLTGEPDDFTTIEGFIRWLTRRYDKLLIPFMVAGAFVVIIANGVFVQPTFILGWTIGEIITGLFIFAMAILFLMLVFSSFILTMKAGKGKGNMKMNLRDKNADRRNEIEIDLIIKNTHRINRNTKRFQIFEEMLSLKGSLILPRRDEEGVKILNSFESLKGDAVIAEIQESVKDWSIDIPKEDYPKFEDEEKKDEEKYSLNPEGEQQQQSLVTQETANSLVFKRLFRGIQNDEDSRLHIREESPLHKFLDGSKDVYVHVLDFMSEYEYKGKKYPGLIFLHEKKTIQEIFPSPSKAFCMIGWTFGDIPVVTTAFIQVDTYKNVPIFYPTETRDRLLMIANLGYYDETLPSQKTVTACKNLIELDISYQLINEIDSMGRKFASHDKSTKRVLRDGLGIDDRFLTIRKKLHLKDDKQTWILIFAVGLIIGFLAFPYVDFIWRSIARIFA